MSHQMPACQHIRILILSALVLISATAQVSNGDVPMAGLEIRGSVVEPGTNGGLTPVAGVEIKLTGFRLVEMMVTPTVIAPVVTDNQGTFLFHPLNLGRYIVDANKAGYRSAAYTGGGSGSTEYVDLTSEVLRQSVRFQITRLGSLTGRVLDEDNNPLAGLKLDLRGSATGYLSIYQATTDPKGDFTVPELTPNKYLVRIAPQSGGPALVPTFTQADLKIIDQDMDTAYWPGGPGVSPTPIVVQPGGVTDVGTIRASKVAYYRAHVQVRADRCEDKEEWTVTAFPTDIPNLGATSEIVPRFLVRCEDAKKSGFLIRNLRPGSYRFTITGGTRDVVNSWALEQVEIKRENVEVSMAMTASSDVVGRVVAAEGAMLPDLKTLMIGAGSVSVPVDAKGQFKITVPWQQELIRVFFTAAAGSNLYVQQVRQNGQPAVDGVLKLAGAPTQVEIVIDDKGGTVAGTILDGDKPTDKAQVVMVKWPLAPAMSNGGVAGRYQPIFNGERPGETFQITGLAPGEYRIMALPREGLSNISEPGILERAAAKGQKVVVDRGGAQNISVKMIDYSKI
ncbi:MAG: carboxypeptidase-like regulatory domain-containing protein [Acidobacteriota bacterium]